MIFQTVYTRQAANAANASAKAALNSSESVKLTERAYISMVESASGFHRSQPLHRLQLTLLIKNYGRTPGTVIRGEFGIVPSLSSQPFIHGLPDAAKFRQQVTGGLYVPARKGASLHSFDGASVILLQEEGGPHHLWLVAYIDYEDRFGGRHRGGWARRIKGHMTTVTWEMWVDETAAPYNYDIEIDEQGNKTV